MKHALPMVALVLASTPASAFCYQSSGYDLASTLQKMNEYLICIHNEQTDRLNEHADIINEQSRVIRRLEDELSSAVDKADDLEREIDLLRGLINAR